MLLRKYLVIKKSTLAVLGLALAGVCLYKHYSKPGNNPANDVADAAKKGKRTTRDIKEEVEQA